MIALSLAGETYLTKRLGECLSHVAPYESITDQALAVGRGRAALLIPASGCTEKSQAVKLKVKRIVSNIGAAALESAADFYADILGLELLMDHGWIRTYGSNEEMAVQISIATEGGSGTVVPDLSIEVDDLDAALNKIKAANIHIEYGPVSEPWGVRRFYVRDPFGKLINILQHE